MAQVNDRGHDDDTRYSDDRHSVGLGIKERSGTGTEGSDDSARTNSDSTGNDGLDIKELKADIDLLKKALSFLIGSSVLGINDDLAKDEARAIRHKLSSDDPVDIGFVPDNGDVRRWGEQAKSAARQYEPHKNFRLEEIMPYQEGMNRRVNEILEQLKIEEERHLGQIAKTKGLSQRAED